jgi:hypothetical protein
MLLESTNGIEANCAAVTAGHCEAEWELVDRRLREYTRHRSALDAAELFDLVRAEQMRIYVFFGYVTLYEYMERVLGYGPHAARERMRVARALVALPETSTALARTAGAPPRTAADARSTSPRRYSSARHATPGFWARWTRPHPSGPRPP